MSSHFQPFTPRASALRQQGHCWAHWRRRHRCSVRPGFWSAPGYWMSPGPVIISDGVSSCSPLTVVFYTARITTLKDCPDCWSFLDIFGNPSWKAVMMIPWLVTCDFSKPSCVSAVATFGMACSGPFLHMLLPAYSINNTSTLQLPAGKLHPLPPPHQPFHRVEAYLLDPFPESTYEKK